MRRHPETPTIYLEQAIRWLGKLEQGHLRHTDQEVGMGGGLETIDDVVEWLLK